MLCLPLGVGLEQRHPRLGLGDDEDSSGAALDIDPGFPLDPVDCRPVQRKACEADVAERPGRCRPVRRYEESGCGSRRFAREFSALDEDNVGACVC